ncbi:peptidoglycan editing factor PgeF [Bacillus xiapuensis]|uniref:peptidoglycan editing factor PgeF n=1 Tax=Bacillus xiapuensis TaxID=2014075 RepID=UPI000C23B882|nr:peptidoglycan editing factor PgeF [Bacillus xiapuensis]
MKEPFVRLHDSLYAIDDWQNEHPGLVAGFTTRESGFSKGDFRGLNTGFHVNDREEYVCANRQLIGNLLEFPADGWIGAEQTHGSRVAAVTKADRGKGALLYSSSFKETDGLYTDDKGTLLTLCYADCVPLYFLAKEVQRIGTAHAGWKGTVLGIGKQMVELWKKDGIPPEDIEVVIGPSICKDCYAVDDRVIEQARRWMKAEDQLPYSPVNGKPGQYHLSLQQLNQLVLLQAGIRKENIQITKLCTSCGDEFFSHRRDAGKTGRMLGFIGWKEAPHHEGIRSFARNSTKY